MTVVVVTGSGGLIGSEAVRHFANAGHLVVGIDNDMRREFFGAESSTSWNVDRLIRDLNDNYRHLPLDIRDRASIEKLFRELSTSIVAVIHAAAQPSHDWAAREPLTDFDINAVGTLNLLEATRQHCPRATFIFMSTNKVYGDTPNRLPLVEGALRYELARDHQFVDGIDETMSIDGSMHSVFGASKVAADIMVQEYGRYFGLHTVCFRGGTLTGPNHSPHALHGFLAYLMSSVLANRPYTVIGYGGKQVRDVIHSVDVVGAMAAFHNNPRVGAVYNLGGGRSNSCSVLEAIALCEGVAQRPLSWTYDDQHRAGDHIWWVGSNAAFERDYPEWDVTIALPSIAEDLAAAFRGAT